MEVGSCLQKKEFLRVFSKREMLMESVVTLIDLSKLSTKEYGVKVNS